ncbi:MAG: hypothetical protein CVU54_16560 [Deltaproteobacteria bacterium HGW-Deltaproteobacteria-12]|jgi:hypothetical protein|nr:MAG: hypothetical protein CVU54_16560 [Deltaproteobacteria bacterium HGW-Deltaproteobacteria-12]
MFPSGGGMEKAVVPRQHTTAFCAKSAQVIIYPAAADSVDLPDLSFSKNREENVFVLTTPREQQLIFQKNANIAERAIVLDDLRLKKLLSPLWPLMENLNITFNIVGRRAALLKIVSDNKNVIVEAHWNLFVPYFDQIKILPIVHPEILDIFAKAVFHYAAIIMTHPEATKNDLRRLIIEGYRAQPELLLASMDIFNKPGIYHIRPTKNWLGRISAANDVYRLQIDVSAALANPLVNPEFLENVTSFIHKVVKNYAFRYVDYLWTQRYGISCNSKSIKGMVSFEGDEIIIDVLPLIEVQDWKPTVYLNLGYAIMLATLRYSGKEHKEENIHLAAMKTWNRYLSFEESAEKQSVRELYSLYYCTEEEQCCGLLECMIGQKSPELIDDFIMLIGYSSKETFLERFNVLKESRYEKRTGVHFEQVLGTVRNMNTSLMRNNINYSKLIEVLRNDNIDHLQLTEFLRTGRLGDRHVVDVSEWLLLRTLLYDVINAPKVFRNDYKMLLKVLTKVNKSLIVYIWTLGINDDPRYEMVSSYIAKLMNDIFVFNRVKIYEIVADPVECLEAEAVTGYLLNWAALQPEERRSIVKEIVSILPRNWVEHLSVQTPDDVDELIRVLTVRGSGIIGFYLHQAYRWGSTNDPLTARIRSNFAALLKHAQGAILPSKRVMGGAMLLLLLAQIISDERDGFAGNITITEEERNAVRDLIKQCIGWGQMHFVIMIAGIAAGYMGSIDGWILQQFDSLLGRYDAGDRVVLRSVVQFDVDNLIERALISFKDGEEKALLNKIQCLRFGVDPVVSDQANKFLRAMASRCGISSPEAALKQRNIRELVLSSVQHLKAQALSMRNGRGWTRQNNRMKVDKRQ